MSKKTFIAAIIITALLISATVEMKSFPLGRAENTSQFYPTNAPPTLVVKSPNNYTTRGYLIPLNVTLFFVTSDYNSSTGMRVDEQWVEWLGYSLDDKPPVIFKEQPLLITSPVHWSTTLNVTGLQEGTHKIEVIAGFGYTTPIMAYAYNFTFNPTYFAIYNTPVVVSNLSVENRTYNTNSIPLVFSVDRPTSWIGYELDGRSNLTIIENTTLTALSDGSHSVVIYANDTVGNMGSSDVVLFTVNTQPSPSPSPTPSPTTQPTASPSPSHTAQPKTGFLGTSLPMEYGYALVSAIVIVGVAVGILGYFRKRRGRGLS